MRACRALNRSGWFVSRQAGSHVILRHPTQTGTRCRAAAQANGFKDRNARTDSQRRGKTRASRQMN
ncbi:MAG: addiction module toxin, HicA family [Chloroflexota bacterium]|nr:MAG: addiction module toxin, HicA family [Chloroflexota bacterium]